MGKMIPVPEINGLEELLLLVKDDSAIKKHLQLMQELRDAIAENLDAYKKHKNADRRLEAIALTEDKVALMVSDAELLKAKVDKSCGVKRKNIKKLEVQIANAEIKLKQKQKVLERKQHEYIDNLTELYKSIEHFEKNKEEFSIYYTDKKAELLNYKVALKNKLLAIRKIIE